MVAKAPARRIYLSSLQALRALIPPWQQTQDPLVSYHLRPHKRTGKRPWTLLVLIYLTLFALNTYLGLLYLQADDNLPLTDLIGYALGIIAVGLGLIVMLGHWRLLLAVAARGADTIAGQRRRGDWDLIAITPMSKTRWFRGQLTAIGWQVFPMLRQLLVAQGLLALLVFGVAIYAFATQDGSTYGDERYLPLGLFILLAVPVVLLFMLEPILSLTLFTLTSLYASSRSQRTSMSVLYSLAGVYIVRALLSMAFFYGGFVIIMVVGAVAKNIGLTDDFSTDLDLNDLSLYFLALQCMYVLASAFFVEWLPGLALLLLMVPNGSGEHVVIYVIIVLTFTLAYILVPLGIIRYLGRAIVWQINQRER